MSDDPRPLESWRLLASRDILALPDRLTVRLDHVALPDGREVEDYLRLILPDFVTILARDTRGRILCERQYKHGPGRVILSLPAGRIEGGEEPLAAARRELLEETGHGGGAWTELGGFVTLANARGPAGHAFLAEGVAPVAAPDSGDLEEIRLEFLTPAEIRAEIARGGFASAADLAALALAFASGLV